MVFCSIEEAIEEVRSGRPLVLVDSPDRENEGDVIIAAEKATLESVAFCLREARGLFCMPVTRQRADEMQLPLQWPHGSDRHGTKFTVSADAREGTSTGMSAADRLATIRAILNPNSTPSDLMRPGHLFPLIAEDWGVLARRGHTEASIDLCRLAGLEPAAIICEIMNPDGSMARLPSLFEFAKKHSLKIASIEDLVRYRLRHETLVEKIAEASLPTAFGEFRIHAFRSMVDGEEIVALTHGPLMDNALVRVHSQCLTGDAFGSRRCDCQPQLREAMRRIAENGSGVVVYALQEGRGIGLVEKIRAYALQDDGLDTVEANVALGHPVDAREFWLPAHVLRALGLGSVRLMTNNPAKVSGLVDYGVVVTERVPIEAAPGSADPNYLAAKREKMGHSLRVVE
jgi:3,4-dihydroxy 2-butanone 4-phosphate synthase/GTP cyclohydrolase II